MPTQGISMPSFRSRQRANMRRECNRRDNEAKRQAGEKNTDKRGQITEENAFSVRPAPRAPYLDLPPGHATTSSKNRTSRLELAKNPVGKWPTSKKKSTQKRDKYYSNASHTQEKKNTDRNEDKHDFKQDHFNKQIDTKCPQSSFFTESAVRSRGSGPKKPFHHHADREPRNRNNARGLSTRGVFDLAPNKEIGTTQPHNLFNLPSHREKNQHNSDRSGHPNKPESKRPHSVVCEGRKSPLFCKPGLTSLKPLSQPHRVESREKHRDAQTAPNRPPTHQAPSLTQVRDSVLSFFAPCPRGLESILADELRGLGGSEIRSTEGGVAFVGRRDLLMAANLHSRIASRVLVQLAHGNYRNEHDIYRLAMNVDWPRWFEVSNSIKVKIDAIRCHLKSLHFISMKVKDAICDRFRQAQLGRPHVDIRHPDIRVHVFLTEHNATIYLDSSGEPLFKRGWRQDTGHAPLRENLAAGILLLAGYNGSQPLLDPMCGSGTFLVEAADIALKRAPGRQRKFAFQKLRGFDSGSWTKLLLNAQYIEKPQTKLTINGSDRDPLIIKVAKNNLERAGLTDLVEVKAMDVLDARPNGEHGILITNPPYGVRMEEQDRLAEWYPLLGSWLKAHFSGWHANLLSGDLRLAELINLAPKRGTRLYNGPLQCKLFAINLVKSSIRDAKPLNY